MSSLKRSNTKKGRRTKSPEPTTTKKLVSVSLGSAVISLSATFLLILIASAVIIGTPDPHSAIAPTGFACLYLCAFICGFTAKRSSPFPAALIGLSSALVLTLLIMTVALLFPLSANSTLTLGAKALIFVSLFPTSMIGAALGGIKPVKKRRAQTRHR